MIKFEIIITEEDVELSEQGESTLLHEAREALEAQALSGKDRDGNNMIGKNGKTLDLHDTGRMWQNVTESSSGKGLVFNESYAEVVLTKYKADALNEASQAALEDKLTAMLQEQVTNQEVK